MCIYADLGSLFRTRCTNCSTVEENYNSPIVPALKDKGYVYILHKVMLKGMLYSQGKTGLIKNLTCWFSMKTQFLLPECYAMW